MGCNAVVEVGVHIVVGFCGVLFGYFVGMGVIRCGLVDGITAGCGVPLLMVLSFSLCVPIGFWIIDG